MRTVRRQRYRMGRRTRQVAAALVAAGLISVGQVGAQAVERPTAASVELEPTTAVPAVLQRVDVDRLSDAAMVVFGGRFAGLWLDAGVLHIAAVAPSVLETAQLEAVDRLAGVKVQAAQYSTATLLSFQDAVSKAYHAYRAGAGGGPIPATISVAYDRNQIRFTTKSTDAALRAALAASVPSGALDIVVDPTLTPKAADSRKTFPPYRGGLAVTDVDTFSKLSCTSGFAFTLNGNNEASTAGHCTDTNTDLNITGTTKQVGVTAINTFRTFESTLQAFGDTTLAGLTDQSAATNRIYINSSLQRNVTEAYSAGGLFLGRPNICKTGVTTGVGPCGLITSTYPTEIDDVEVADIHSTNSQFWDYFNQVCSTGTIGNSGDSGAPVYTPTSSSAPFTARAAGTLDIFFGLGTPICFDPVFNIESRTGASLKTS